MRAVGAGRSCEGRLRRAGRVTVPMNRNQETEEKLVWVEGAQEFHFGCAARKV